MAKRQPTTSQLLIHEQPLQVLPSLAVAVGLNEAMVLQQMHYWLLHSKHEMEGEHWVYNTYEDWHAQFPFWSLNTIKRAIHALEQKGLVISTAKFNRNAIDKSKWYRINYTQLARLCESSTTQNESSTTQNESSTTQNESSTTQNESLDDPKWVALTRAVKVFIPETSPEITNREKPLVSSIEETPPSGDELKLTPTVLMAWYNELTPPTHPKAHTLSPKRREKAQRVLKAFPDPDFWRQVFAEVSGSPFLRGDKASPGHAGFRADFDWLLTTGKDGTENCVKVAEGKYREPASHAVRADCPIPELDTLVSAKGQRTLLASQRLLQEMHNGQDGLPPLLTGPQCHGRTLL